MIDAATLERVRAVRLWHWQQVREASLVLDLDIHGEPKRRAYEKRNLHMGFVQTLNDLFPLGDTAERDAARRP